MIYTSKSLGEIKTMFDRVASKYDFSNTFLSLNQDKVWRKTAVRKSINGSEKSILDIGTGTGALLEVFLREHSFDRAVGIDLSSKMLALAKKRLGEQATLLVSEGAGLPFHKSDFDIVSCAFVLRSISDIPSFFKEVYQVLKLQGKFVCLELTRPSNPVMKLLYEPYVKWYLPCAGKLITGNWNAYEFLSTSIQKFYDRGACVNFLTQAGFNTVKIHSLTGGICTLVIAEKNR